MAKHQSPYSCGRIEFWQLTAVTALLMALVGCQTISRGLLDESDDDDSSADDDDTATPDDDDSSADDDDTATSDDDDSSDDDDDDTATSDDDDTSLVEPPSAVIDTPGFGAIFEESTDIHFTGTVGDAVDEPSTLQVRWLSDVSGEFATSIPTGSGAVTATTNALPAGNHLITLEVTNSEDLVTTATVELGVCSWGVPDTFDTLLGGSGWQTYGDAYWDPGGWLEMTNNLQGRKGAIFNLIDTVTPGDVSISFSIRTGPNVGNGADGFAMSVINASSVTELETVIAASASGGGLAYGYGGAWGPHVVQGFHVEIDTWHNVYNGTNEHHTDPTTENHIAVCLDGDPGNCPLFSPVPNIEDNTWHLVEVEVSGSFVTVRLDNMDVIAADVPGLTFRGGFIGFSGSTGFYTNYHSFDNLQILEECFVPE